MASNMDLAKTAAKALGLPSLEDALGSGKNNLVAGMPANQVSAEPKIADTNQVHQFHGSTSGRRVCVEV